MCFIINFYNFCYLTMFSPKAAKIHKKYNNLLRIVKIFVSLRRTKKDSLNKITHTKNHIIMKDIFNYNIISLNIHSADLYNSHIDKS